MGHDILRMSFHTYTFSTYIMSQAPWFPSIRCPHTFSPFTPDPATPTAITSFPSSELPRPSPHLHLIPSSGSISWHRCIVPASWLQLLCASCLCAVVSVCLALLHFYVSLCTSSLINKSLNCISFAICIWVQPVTLHSPAMSHLHVSIIFPLLQRDMIVAKNLSVYFTPQPLH